MEFSRTVNRFGEEIFAALNDRRIELEKTGKKIYNLSVGTPDFEAPAHIKKALADAAPDQNNWKYSLRDSDELVAAVISYYKKRYGVDLTADEIQSCNGTQDGMGHIGLVLCNEGDTVLLPTPCYPAFITAVTMCGAKAEYYPMVKENGFLPHVADIPDETADRAKFMVVSLPSNPMGSVGTPEIYAELIDFAKKHDILIVHDNAYSDIIFDGVEGKSFLSYPGAREVGVEFYSLSKSYNYTGARVSFLVGNKELIRTFKKLRSQIDYGTFLPVQMGAIAALNGPDDFVISQCQAYEERRNALCDGFTNAGWKFERSEGTMFAWAKIPAKYQDDVEFVKDLFEKTGVLCTPGSSFGTLGKGHVRFALVLPVEVIKEAVEKVRESGILL